MVWGVWSWFWVGGLGGTWGGALVCFLFFCILAFVLVGVGVLGFGGAPQLAVGAFCFLGLLLGWLWFFRARGPPQLGMWLFFILASVLFLLLYLLEVPPRGLIDSVAFDRK